MSWLPAACSDEGCSLGEGDEESHHRTLLQESDSDRDDVHTASIHVMNCFWARFVASGPAGRMFGGFISVCAKKQ